MSQFEEKLRKDFQDKEYAHAYMEESLNHYIATQIKVLREQRQLTQTQLAELAEMKQGRISVLEDVDYESWSIKSLKQLANAFDVALHVSFETFSKSIKMIEGFNRKSLERPSRMQDLMEEPVVETDEDILYKLQTIKSAKVSGVSKSALDVDETLVCSPRSDITREYSSSCLYSQNSNSVGQPNLREFYQ